MKAASALEDKWLPGMLRRWGRIPCEQGSCLLCAMGAPLQELRVPSPEAVWDTAGGHHWGGPGKMQQWLLQCLQPRSGDKDSSIQPCSSTAFSSAGFHLISLPIRAGKAFL